jgi:hypothetical protein
MQIARAVAARNEWRIATCAREEVSWPEFHEKSENAEDIKSG